MDLGGWVSLLVCAGALGSLAYFTWTMLSVDRHNQRPFRPVWIVLLAGGMDETDRRGGPDGGGGGGGGDDRPPRVPPRAPRDGVSRRQRHGHLRRPPQRTSTKRAV